MKVMKSCFRLANMIDIDLRCLRHYIQTMLLKYCSQRQQMSTQSTTKLNTQTKVCANASSQNQSFATNFFQFFAIEHEQMKIENMFANDVIAKLEKLKLL